LEIVKRTPEGVLFYASAIVAFVAACDGVVGLERGILRSAQDDSNRELRSRNAGRDARVHTSPAIADRRGLGRSRLRLYNCKKRKPRQRRGFRL